MKHYSQLLNPIKKSLGMKDSFIEHDYNFNDDLIDQHIGISITPSVISLRGQTGQMPSHANNSGIHVLKSIQNSECRKIGRKKLKYMEGKFAYDNTYQRMINGENQYYRDEDIAENSIKKSKLYQRFEQKKLKKQIKIKTIKQQLIQKQMKQCTFQPKLLKNLKKQKLQKRNLQQFLTSQYEHIKRVQKKNLQLKKKYELLKKQQQCFKPKINKNLSMNLERIKNKKNIHQRLYQLKQNKTNKSTQQQTTHKSKNHTHKYQYRRTIPTTNLLYQDAQRRQNLIKTIDKTTKTDQCDPITQQLLKNKNTEKYVSLKFLKQFYFALQKLQLLPIISEEVSPQMLDEALQPQQQWKQKQTNIHEHYCNKCFTQQQFYSILKELGFLVYDQNQDNQLAVKQKNLAFEAYQILQQYSVTTRNILVFLLSLLGIFNMTSINFSQHSSLSSKQSNLLQLNEKQGRKLQKYFNFLYRNRLSQKSLLTKRVPKLHQTSKNLTFSPSQSSNYISPRHQQHTKQLASKYRSKMIQRANERFIQNNIHVHIPQQNMLTHQDLLVIDSLGRNLQIKKIKQNKDAVLDQQCTFHPKVNKKNYQDHLCQTDRLKDKCKYQHQQHKSKYLHDKSKWSENHSSRFKKIQNTNTEQSLSMEKPAFKKFTKTSTIKQKHSSSSSQQQRLPPKKQSQQYPKDIDKAIARMVLARKQRQQKNKLLQRGQPNHSNQKNAITSSHLQSCINLTHHNNSINTMQPINSFRQLSINNEYSEQDHREQPFLVVDVNIGIQSQQLQFFTGDQKKVGQIVDQFCFRFKLDNQCKNQLLTMVQIQIQKYLNNFGIESTDCREDY